VAEWPFPPTIVPMEAQVADELPPPPLWAYEPKWDGFRAVMWSRSGTSAVRLDSRNAKPLLRYFPELEPVLGELPGGTVLDGELVVLIEGRLDFDALQNRIHPAESRVRRLAGETPASLALFDLLAVAGRDCRGLAYIERRALLEELASDLVPAPLLRTDGVRPSAPVAAGGLGLNQTQPPWLLSPSTTNIEVAKHWFFELEPAGFDGIVAKALHRPYAEGRREMIKVKHRRTVDCVVGGYRISRDGTQVGSLLLGLYTDEGELHFIGHCSSFGRRDAELLLDLLLPLSPAPGAQAEAGFGAHVRRPGGPSRWSGGKDLDFIPVSPVLVVEITYDQLTGERFRHATRFERWRPDKEARDCTMNQLERPKGPDVIAALNQAHQNHVHE